MRILGFRYAAALAMIGLILLSGLPVFVFENANHDRKVDLRDAVILLQIADNKEFLENTPSKRKSATDIKNSLKAVAGLKKIVPPAFETKKSFSSHFCFFVSCVDIHPVFLNYDSIIEHSVNFSSIISSLLYQPQIFHKPVFHNLIYDFFFSIGLKHCGI